MSDNVAFVFPGQGSQKIGMLSQLASVDSIIQGTFSEASDALGYDLWHLVQNGSQEEINLTERTQPILLTASVAIWRLWQDKKGARPSQLAGHSLGEWTALVCAGVLTFADALVIVRARGQYMQEAVPVGVGAMAAIIGLDDEAVLQVCAEARGNDVLDAVNFNAPGQVVIAGGASAVQRAIECCKAAGAKRALPLPVSAPFHTSLMAPAAERLKGLVAETPFAEPIIPVIHNVHAETEVDPTKIKMLMLEQISQPVKWVDCVLKLKSGGAERLVECGPGRVLNGLSKRIDRELISFATDDVENFENALLSV
jgi:[acyl-carrier-protein] S-malonyltransferase